MNFALDVANLVNYKKNFYSQNGEDGILIYILDWLRSNNVPVGKWCCEFGAWDGKHLSNTFNLVESFNWSSVYIEGDFVKFQDLLKTVTCHPSIQPINKYVAPNRKSDDSIDSLLSTTDIPCDFDILSIDIDSYDLEIWETMEAYRPKIVIIEINSYIPPGILWRHDNKSMDGNSFSSTLEVAKVKSYQLVCMTGNLIFVDTKYIKFMNLPERMSRYPELFFDSTYIVNSRTSSGLFARLGSKLRSLVNLSR